MNKPFEKDPTEQFMLFPNAIIDDLMPILPPPCFKIICLIYRKTKGWNKEVDQISFSQIMKGTGIKSSATVAKYLNSLVQKGIILRDRGDSTWDANSYALNPNFDISTLKNKVEPTLKNKVEPTLKNKGTKDSLQIQEIQSPNGENIPQPNNNQPKPNPLTDKQTDELMFFGKHPDTTQNQQFDTIQQIRKAGWEIRDPTVEQGMAHYLEAVRQHHPSFAIPNDKSVRSDWYKSVKGHLEDYPVADLEKLYQATVDRLKEQGMSFTRPGSLTKSLPDVSMETQSGDVVAWF